MFNLMSAAAVAGVNRSTVCARSRQGNVRPPSLNPSWTGGRHLISFVAPRQLVVTSLGYTPDLEPRTEVLNPASFPGLAGFAILMANSPRARSACFWTKHSGT